MIYTLNLTRNNYVRAEPNEAFSVGAGNLVLSLKLDNVLEQNETLKLIITNNSLTKEFVLAVPEFSVPKEFLEQGKLTVTISVLRNGKIVRHWVVYPIIIMNAGEMDKHLAFVDWCDQLEKRVTEALETLRKEKNELFIANDTFKSEQKEKIQKLTSKFEDYFNNIL